MSTILAVLQARLGPQPTKTACRSIRFLDLACPACLPAVGGRNNGHAMRLCQLQQQQQFELRMRGSLWHPVSLWLQPPSPGRPPWPPSRGLSTFATTSHRGVQFEHVHRHGPYYPPPRDFNHGHPFQPCPPPPPPFNPGVSGVSPPVGPASSRLRWPGALLSLVICALLVHFTSTSARQCSCSLLCFAVRFAA